MCMNPRKHLQALLWLALCLCVWPSLASAERLPVKRYTAADGLARDYIMRIVRDARGFLWFCTSEGLSRFDGYRFANYGVEQGLPGRVVHDVLATRGGVYWVATNNGVCRLDTAGRCVPGYRGASLGGHEILDLFEDRQGVVWCGGFNAFYQLTSMHGEWVSTAIPLGTEEFDVRGFAEDSHGALWMLKTGKLYRRQPDGRMEHFGSAEGLGAEFRPTGALQMDRSGALWVATLNGLYQFVPEPRLGAPAVAHIYTTREGLGFDGINDILPTADGALWVSLRNGAVSVAESNSSLGARRFHTYGKANGLPLAGALAEDRDGNVWLGTESDGVVKISAHGFTSYSENDGFVGTRVASLFLDRERQLCAAISPSEGTGLRLTINRFDGQRFAATQIGLPAGLTAWNWSWYQTVFQAQTGEWWMQTGQGVVRYPASARLEQLPQTKPLAIYTKRNGLADAEPFRIYEDTRGDVWIGTFSQSDGTLTRWERRTSTLQRFTAADGIPARELPTAFGEDASGQLWIGIYSGGVLRYRNGHFERFSAAEGVPGGILRAIYLDGARRLWLATGEGGAVRVDDPQANTPHFIRYGHQEGLASDQATCFTEDQWGRLYIGTGRGVDQLDVASGQIKHFTTADGLPNSFVNVALRDHAGALWFGTLQGLARLNPQPPQPRTPPPILLSEFNVAGKPFRLSALGTTEFNGLTLQPQENQLRIQFFGLSFVPGEVLRYQYKLEGMPGDWSTPSDQRTVNYANLAPGAYRFLVRAVASDGTVSTPPATLSLRVLAPVWRRWWFLLLNGAVLSALAWVFTRTRRARAQALRESEARFRTLAETASDAIITIDATGLIVFANQATEKVFGHTAAEMLGHDLTMLMPEYLRHVHQAGFARYQQTGQRHISWQAVELPGCHKDGHEIPLELSFGEFTRNGQRFFTGIARDISERRRAQEELQASREERLRELERVRRRIATDLHDDIGSSLTQISILSEVLRQRLDGDPRATAPLDSIADASRELVDSMSDIVWAINPQKDKLGDLLQRMRRFAADSFSARNIRCELALPDEAMTDLPLGANLRREVFLIYKESVNNLLKHSGCTTAHITLQCTARALRLEVRDDGRGFDLAKDPDGHGLMSMSDRARDIGGDLQFISQPGAGTTVTLTVPLEANTVTGRLRDLGQAS